MKRLIISMALFLVASFPALERVCRSEDTPRWELNERRLALDAIKEEERKKPVSSKEDDDFPQVAQVFQKRDLSRKELLKKCDSEYEVCQEKVLKVRKSCSSENEACIKECRRQSVLCLSAAEDCEKGARASK